MLGTHAPDRRRRGGHHRRRRERRPQHPSRPPPPPGARMKRLTILILALGFLAAPFASSHPDGLERVALDLGFADARAETMSGLHRSGRGRGQRDPPAGPAREAARAERGHGDRGVHHRAARSRGLRRRAGVAWRLLARIGPRTILRPRADRRAPGAARSPRSAPEIAPKALIGTFSAVLLGATTSFPDVLHALERLQRAEAARADRGLHVPVPVHDRRRGPAHAGRARRPRLPAPPRAADRGDRPGRDGAVPAHLRARRARAPGDARARLAARAMPRLDALAFTRADALFLAALATPVLADPVSSHELRHPRPRPALRLPQRGHRRSMASTSTSRHGERVAVARPQRRRQDDADAPPQRAADRRELEVAGLSVGHDDVRDLRARVGLIFQDPDDQLFMPTVREDVAFGPLNLGLSKPEVEDRVEAALEAVRMSEHADRAPHQLSLGQRRRVAIATVLAMDPSLLVLDEPSANLDPRTRRELMETLERIDRTLLIVTHDLPLAARLCERAVLLSARAGSSPTARARPARRRAAPGRARPGAARGRTSLRRRSRPAWPRSRPAASAIGTMKASMPSRSSLSVTSSRSMPASARACRSAVGSSAPVAPVDAALGARGLERRHRHRVDRVRRDEAPDVQRRRVGRVLDAGRRPQRALDGRARLAQRGEALALEDALERLVGGARVGQAGTALQLGVARGLEALVDLGVHARDEEGRDRMAVQRLAPASRRRSMARM